MPGGAFSGARRTNHPCTNRFQSQSVDILNVIQWDPNPCNTIDMVGVKPSLLIALHSRSNRMMILPVGTGRQEGIPSPNFYSIVASGQSPLSFASGRWSPQHSILRTTVPSLAYDGLGLRPKPCGNKPCYHMASTHGGVDLASSDGRKALGVDGHPILLHRQI